MFKGNFNPAYSSLETLTWYPEQKKMLLRYLPEFQALAADQTKIEQDRMGLGVKVRSILVNLEALPLSKLYSQEEIEKGRNNNEKGRKFVYPKDI